MQVINLSFGQCGNQIGEQFYDLLCEDIYNSSAAYQACALDSFFYHKDDMIYPRSILVDMEPKVVQQCLQRKKTNFQFDQNLSFVNQMGSGNNWAFGFNQHGPDSKQKILDLIQTQLEQVDFIDGITIMQSLAGGTGSGLGSYITQELKLEYPKVNILNISILPNIQGEVIIQNYNCLLSLACMQENRQLVIIKSDGIILIENDHVENTCKQLYNIKNPKIDDLNKVIVQQLASIFSPVINRNLNKSIYSPMQNQFNYITDIYNNLLLNPNHKLLKIFNVPSASDQSKEFNNDTWIGLEKRIVQMIISNSSEANINWQINQKSKNICQYKGIIIIARGIELKNFEFQKTMPYQKILYDGNKFNKNEKSISAITNGGIFNDKIEKIILSASQMFQKKAFFYQYEKYGIQENDFLNSMIVCEQILKNYQQI